MVCSLEEEEAVIWWSNTVREYSRPIGVRHTVNKGVYLSQLIKMLKNDTNEKIYRKSYMFESLRYTFIKG